MVPWSSVPCLPHISSFCPHDFPTCSKPHLQGSVLLCVCCGLCWLFGSMHRPETTRVVAFLLPWTPVAEEAAMLHPHASLLTVHHHPPSVSVCHLCCCSNAVIQCDAVQPMMTPCHAPQRPNPFQSTPTERPGPLSLCFGESPSACCRWRAPPVTGSRVPPRGSALRRCCSVMQQHSTGVAARKGGTEEGLCGCCGSIPVAPVPEAVCFVTIPSLMFARAPSEVVGSLVG